MIKINGLRKMEIAVETPVLGIRINIFSLCKWLRKIHIQYTHSGINSNWRDPIREYFRQ